MCSQVSVVLSRHSLRFKYIFYEFGSSFLFKKSRDTLSQNQNSISHFRNFLSQTSAKSSVLSRVVVADIENNFKMLLPAGMLHNCAMKLKPNEILNRTEKLINNCRIRYDEVAAVPEKDVTYETVLKVLADIECEFNTERLPLENPQHLSNDRAIRDASTDADQKLQAFDVEISMRADLFKKLLVLEKKKEPMKPEAKRYLERLIKLGQRNGLHLQESLQKEIKDLTNKINNLSIQFSRNVNEADTKLEFTEEELDGLPSDFIASLKRNADSGKLEITLKYPHYVPTMQLCRNAETRRKMEFAFNTECADENASILKELVELRHKKANLLGFPSHIAYVTDFRMAKTPEKVFTFLTDLEHKLTPLWEKEKQYMLELKEKECNELNIPFDGKMNAWDIRYFITKVEEKKYAVNKSKLKEYFPLPVVLQGLITIYQEMLGLKFKEIKGTDVWDDEVRLFSVKDSSDDRLLGYFFLDLFPRTGKYGHAAKFEFQPGCLLADGSRQISVAGVVTNFNEPQADKPSLLDHGEVTTFFHEFGHLMHEICAQTDLAHFSGTKVERDFLEAPSQMLENWCWEVEPIKKMSAHYSDQKDIPEDMLKSLINSKLANAGYTNLRQVFYALYDYKIHSNPNVDLKQTYYDLQREILNIEATPGTHFPCRFTHLAGGYEAQYYSYLWSEVYSDDMFCSRFKNGNVMNPEIGMEYRNKILKHGGTKDANDMLLDFLGREPTYDAFLQNKGLKT